MLHGALIKRGPCIAICFILKYFFVDAEIVVNIRLDKLHLVSIYNKWCRLDLLNVAVCIGEQQNPAITSL